MNAIIRLKAITVLFAMIGFSLPARAEPFEDAHFTCLMKKTERVETEKIVVITDTEASTARAVATDLTILLHETDRLLASAAAPTDLPKQVIILFADEKLYRETIALYFPGSKRDLVLHHYHHLVASLGGLPADTIPRMLQFEIGRQWLARNICGYIDLPLKERRYPEALEYGLSEIMERAAVASSTIRWDAVDAGHAARLRARLETGGFPSIRTLLNMDTKAFRSDLAANIAASWGLFHYLLNGENGRLRVLVTRLVEGFRRNESGDQDLTEAIERTGIHEARLNAGYVNHLKLMKGDPVVPPADEPDIRQWIAGLGADTYDQRVSAGQRLLERGPPVLPYLQEALRDPDPEIRHRAGMILSDIGRLPYTHAWILTDPK